MKLSAYERSSNKVSKAVKLAIKAQKELETWGPEFKCSKCRLVFRTFEKRTTCLDCL